MTNASTIILAPYIVAFVSFVLRFYSREQASSMFRLSFLLALFTVVLAAAYLVLGTLDYLPPYSTLGFGIAGLILLGVSIFRWFVI
jgi:hypothetical protein